MELSRISDAEDKLPFISRAFCPYLLCQLYDLSAVFAIYYMNTEYTNAIISYFKMIESVKRIMYI